MILRTEKSLFDVLNVALFVVFSLVMIYPFWYVLVIAFNESVDASRGGLWVFPRKPTILNFAYVLRSSGLLRATFVTLARVAIDPIYNLALNILCAYALTKRDLPGRKAILTFLVVPMFIGGSLITRYLLLVKLHLVNTFWVYVIPNGFSFFTMVIMRTYMEQIPIEMEESAKMDGAGYILIFFRIMLPLSIPIVATFWFFGVVGGWLDLQTNLFFITKANLACLQFQLYQILKSAQIAVRDMEALLDQAAMGSEAAQAMLNVPSSQSIKMSMLVIVTFPLFFVYPFFQRYFVKGLMVGAIKA